VKDVFHDFIRSVLWRNSYGFAISGLTLLRNLWNYDLRINHKNFADLRFADWHTEEIFADLQFMNTKFVFRAHL
jgi:hypothetical protein